MQFTSGLTALSAWAVAVAGGTLTAAPASAAGETLSFIGANSNSATTVAGTLNSSLAPTAYGVKIDGLADNTRPLKIDVLSGPTGGLLAAERIAGNGAPSGGTFTGLVTGTATPVTATTTTGSKSVTFSAAPSDGASTPISLNGRILRFGAAPAVQFAIVSDHTAGTTTATLSVAAITSAGNQLAESAPGPVFITTPVQPSTPSADYTHTMPALTAGDNLYFGSAVAGTYTFRVFADTASDGVYQANADDTTPTFTLTVKNPADAFTFTAPSTVTAGTLGAQARVTANVDTVDVRGGSPGVLSTALAGALGIGLTDNGSGGGGVGGEGTGTTVQNTTTDGLHRYLGSDATTALTEGSGTPKTLTSELRFNGTVIPGATRTTEVVSNSVASLALAVEGGQSKDVKVTGADAAVRSGVADVSYLATAKDSDGKVLAGKAVTFTLVGTSGISASTDLKANDAAVPSNGQVIVTTGSDGVATLKVTSAKTADGNRYTVAAASGTASGGPVTSTYAATVATTVTTSSRAALVGGSAVLSGKVVDQFGQPFTASGLVAALAVTGSATPTTGNYVISADGRFTATVTDTTGNTTARNDTFGWTVSTVGSGSKTLAWRASITPGALAIASTTISGNGTTDVALPFTSSTTTVDMATSGAFTGDVETVKGSVMDAAATPGVLPFAEVAYSGSEGVWFYDVDTTLTKTMTAVATSTGRLSYDGTADGVRVLFTKPGDATITAKSGSVTKTVTVPVEASSDGYRVTAMDLSGRPGGAVTAQGTVTDAFGNPAVGRLVTVAVSSSSAGTLSGPDAAAVVGYEGLQVFTDSQGTWRTPFTSSANQSGSVTLTVTLYNAGNNAMLTANPAMNAAWAAAGVTLGAGVFRDTATVKIAAVELTLAASPTLRFGTSFYARGARLVGSGADANATVEVYAKPVGGRFGLVGTVKADSSGAFSAVEKISRSTFFLVKSGSASSAPAGTRVVSGVVLTGTSRMPDRVTLSANGGPNASTVASFYRVLPGGKAIKLGSRRTNAFGNVVATFPAPTGARTFKVTYKAPGTAAGSDTAVVRVR